MTFELKILGSASATPTPGRHPTAQVLTVGASNYLIDCGEGTQWQMLEHRVRPHQLRAIFISHLHGDHYFGLFGLLGTMHLQGRTQPLHHYWPARPRRGAGHAGARFEHADGLRHGVYRW